MSITRVPRSPILCGAAWVRIPPCPFGVFWETCKVLASKNDRSGKHAWFMWGWFGVLCVSRQTCMFACFGRVCLWFLSVLECWRPCVQPLKASCPLKLLRTKVLLTILSVVLLRGIAAWLGMCKDSPLRLNPTSLSRLALECHERDPQTHGMASKVP